MTIRLKQMMPCERCKVKIERKSANQRFCANCRKIVEKERVEEVRLKKENEREGWIIKGNFNKEEILFIKKELGKNKKIQLTISKSEDE